jgi:hypothetical protein
VYQACERQAAAIDEQWQRRPRLRVVRRAKPNVSLPCGDDLDLLDAEVTQRIHEHRQALQELRVLMHVDAEVLRGLEVALALVRDSKGVRPPKATCVCCGVVPRGLDGCSHWLKMLACGDADRWNDMREWQAPMEFDRNVELAWRILARLPSDDLVMLSYSQAEQKRRMANEAIGTPGYQALKDAVVQRLLEETT